LQKGDWREWMERSKKILKRGTSNGKNQNGKEDEKKLKESDKQLPTHCADFFKRSICRKWESEKFPYR
jgi:hypothetical protein